MATSLTLTTVAIAWLYYRPLFAVAILAAAAVPLFFSRQKANRDQQSSRDR